MKFNEILDYLIDNANVSQARIAKDLNITRSRLNNYISGRSKPDFELLKQIASYFDVTLDYLLGRNTTVISVKQNSFIPEIVMGQQPLQSDDSEVQWVPIYLAAPSPKDKAEDEMPLPLGWLKTKRRSIDSIGFRTHYALLVNDKSMAPELMPGDIAYVQPSFFLHSIIPRNILYSLRLYHTDPVGLAIKRCFIMDNIIIGLSDQSSYEPLIFNMERTVFEPIVGRIVGVWRSVSPENILNTLLKQERVL